VKHGKDSGTATFDPILRTKLYRPQLTAELIDRERLIPTMNRAREVPLTLVSAPAGYGKSVLVAQWVEQFDCPIAWLSLDASDSELRTFLQYFLAAVGTASPGAFDATRELLQAASLAPVPTLAGYLLNDLDAINAPCGIVLDDYHRIDPASPVHDLMIRMLAHPPAQFRFVVLTRQDPPFELPSLRAGHRINDVRLQDLRFTGHETSEFLSATTDLSVSDEVLTHLEREVEGWAAGLRLVSLALRHARDADAFLNRLPGRLPEIQEYLLREVLAAQAAGVRDRMLACSILDRFCAEALDAVFEPADPPTPSGFTASDFLEELGKSNLFTIALDARRKWFRFHHLFQQLLRNELQRDRGSDHVFGLHLRASRWFEGEGLIDEAIKHALEAEDVERAAELVARHRHEALNADRWYDLAKWLTLIPEAFVQQYPELLMARAWIVLNHYYRAEAAPPLLDQVESLLGDRPKAEGVRGEVALGRGYVLWLMGHGAESLHHVEAALERVPVSRFEMRAHAELVFAMSSQMVGRKEQGMHFLDDLLARSESLDETRESRLLISRVFIDVMEGDLLGAEVANRRMWGLVERGCSAYVRAWTDYMQGVIHLQRCEWEEAVEHLERSVARRFLHHVRAAVDSMIGLTLAHQALGRADEARAALQALNEHVAPLGDPAMESLAVSAEARLAILQGQSEAARRWVEASEPTPEGALLWWIDIPSFTRCRATIAVGAPGGLVKAEAQLRECAKVAEAQHNTCHRIRVLTLLAMACDRQGKTEQALGTLERAVALARKGDLVLPFVELGTPMVDLLDKLTGEREFTARVERLVNAFGLEKRPVVAGRNLVGLTNRELDVLELLALRLRNKEIADRLSISDQTVGSHLKQIYEKLGVHGRRKAVERAVETGILDRHPPD
jgi:LuxR family maltose regulon positive regulatory protein